MAHLVGSVREIILGGGHAAVVNFEVFTIGEGGFGAALEFMEEFSFKVRVNFFGGRSSCSG